MTGKSVPETIEHRWDLFYQDYPEIYDRFGKIPKKPTVVEVINQHFPLAGKTVIDIGAGSGLSTFELAMYADHVIGIEPELSMRSLAEEALRQQAVSNVEFREGWAERLPLADRSADMAVAITLASLYSEENISAFIHEAERVTRQGGVVLTVDLASRWYGGDLAEVIAGKPRAEMEDNLRDLLFPRFGYQRIEFDAVQDYGTVENAIQTYGFIFGKNAIDHIREHQKTVITWKLHIHYRRIM